jgi:hypothetical protein
MRAWKFTGVMALGVVAGAVSSLADQSVPAVAERQIYSYSVLHPLYGEIGTFTDTIDRSSETTRIDGHLRIAVKVLGVVAYRMASDTTEIICNDRLVSLRSVTEKDGQHIQVIGEARGDQFVGSASAGSFAGPATIVPSDPWVLKNTGEETVIFTDTGRIYNVHISGGDYDTISMNGASVLARHYVVMGVRRNDVWFDSRKIPVLFRIVEDGTPIDFVLQSSESTAAIAPAADPARAALTQAENSEKK